MNVYVVRCWVGLMGTPIGSCSVDTSSTIALVRGLSEGGRGRSSSSSGELSRDSFACGPARSGSWSMV